MSGSHLMWKGSDRLLMWTGSDRLLMWTGSNILLMRTGSDSFEYKEQKVILFKLEC